jgi:hypothetical protein
MKAPVMKLSIHLLRLLVLMYCGGANEMSRAAEVANTNALRVMVEPSPYLLLKLTGSSLDNRSRVQRRSFHFVEMKGTNVCGFGFLQSQAANMNQTAVEALLTEALEKEGTRDAAGVLRKPKSEIVFFVPAGKPQGQFQGWLEWDHNPDQRLPVAPWIRLRIENGIVKELDAGRG